MLRLQMSTQSSYGRIVQGWIAAHNGDTTAGIALTREGFARAEATGSRNYYPLHLGLLAEALALAGEVDEGISSSTRLSQRQPPPARGARTQSFTACAAS